jgi:hypothetical protein
MSPEEIQDMVGWIQMAVSAPERIGELTVKGAGLGNTPLADGIIAALAMQAAASGVRMGGGTDTIPVESAVIIAALALETGVAMGRGYEAYVRDRGELERLMRG